MWSEIGRDIMKDQRFFPSVEGVCDDNYIFRIHGLINFTSNSKEFGFSAHDI